MYIVFLVLKWLSKLEFWRRKKVVQVVQIGGGDVIWTKSKRTAAFFVRTSLRTGTNILSQFECLISLQVFVMSERRTAHGRRASTEDSTDQECAFPLQVPNRSTMWHKAPLHPQASRVLSAMSSKAPLSARELWPGLATTCSQGLAGRARGTSRSNNIQQYFLRHSKRANCNF